MAYMINGSVGLLAMMVLLIYDILIDRNRKTRNRSLAWFRRMVLALPMGYIGILGPSVHQLFSWYNLFLVFFLGSLFKRWRSRFIMKKSVLLCLSMILVLMIIRNLIGNDVLSAFTEIAQVVIFLLPICLISDNTKRLNYTKEEVDELYGHLLISCSATAVATLMQVSAHRMMKIRLGLMTFQGNGRVSYNCLFRGASILPIFLGIGFLYCLINILNKKIERKYLFFSFFIFIAMVLSSSRAGLAAMLGVSVLIFVRKVTTSLNVKTIFFAAIMIVAGVLAISYILTSRSALTGFLDSNHRERTIENGMQIWTRNMGTLLVGAGYASPVWKGIVKPHNFVIQTLAQNGALVFGLIVAMILIYLMRNRKKALIYLPLYLFIAGLTVTDYYANPFVTVTLILVALEQIESKDIAPAPLA